MEQDYSNFVKFIPPALRLLPTLSEIPPITLFPLQQLKLLQGDISSNEPLNKKNFNVKLYEGDNFHWIGDAFPNIIYQKYPSSSYEKISGREQLWNLLAYDLSVLSSEKPQPKKQQIQIQPFYKIIDQKDKTLVFQSRFESGNLSLSSKISNTEYNLLLQNDINTIGYTQWFFFKVTNTRAQNRIKFNILNLYKQNNLYKVGMKILVYSKKNFLSRNIGWFRDGQDINYFQNGLINSRKNFRRFYTLTWQYTFEFDDDEVYFAYNYPYTYTDLNNYLKQNEDDMNRKKYLKRTLLTKSVLGNRLDLLTITENFQIKKKYIFISARVHPGETVSSYVAQGIINFLLSSNPKAIILRQNYIFKIIPMLNPDGVIHGNYRSNLSGNDLNRVWQQPSPNLHPQIYHLKKLILKLQQESQIILFCDLHGHSIKKNSFVYGCHNSIAPFLGKQFPYLIGKLFKGFEFQDCRFLTSEIREGSARSTLFKELQINNIFTLQSSFCGPQNQSIHFSIQNFEELGKSFCQALLIYFQPNIRRVKNSYMIESTISFRQKAMRELYRNKAYMKQILKNENSQGSEGQKQQQNLLTEDMIKKFIKSSKKSRYETRNLSTTQTISIKNQSLNLKVTTSPTVPKKYSRPFSTQKIMNKVDSKSKIIKLKPTVFCIDNFFFEKQKPQQDFKQTESKIKHKSQNLIYKLKQSEMIAQSTGNFEKILIPNKFECLRNSSERKEFKSKTNMNNKKNIYPMFQVCNFSPQKIRKFTQQNKAQSQQSELFLDSNKRQKSRNLFKSVLKSLKCKK